MHAYSGTSLWGIINTMNTIIPCSLSSMAVLSPPPGAERKHTLIGYYDLTDTA